MTAAASETALPTAAVATTVEEPLRGLMGAERMYMVWPAGGVMSWAKAAAPEPTRMGWAPPFFTRKSSIWLRMDWICTLTLPRSASMLELAKAGTTMAARMPRMTTTTRISMRVKAARADLVMVVLSPGRGGLAERPRCSAIMYRIRRGGKRPRAGSAGVWMRKLPRLRGGGRVGKEGYCPLACACGER